MEKNKPTQFFFLVCVHASKLKCNKTVIIALLTNEGQ